MFQLNARSCSTLILRGTRIAGIGGKSYQCDRLKCDIASSITTCMEISYILYMPKRLGRQFNKEDRKGDIGRHVLHIDRHRIEETDCRIALHNRHRARCIGKGFFHSAREKWELNNHGRWL